MRKCDIPTAIATIDREYRPFGGLRRMLISLTFPTAYGNQSAHILILGGTDQQCNIGLIASSRSLLNRRVL
jgi:hypothetical protein